MEKQIRILCLGDSYTIGEGVSSGERWPDLLCEILRKHYTNVEPPTVVANTGWTTDELMAAIPGYALTGTWDIVTVMIGVNDQYRGRSLLDFREPLDRLFDCALAIAGCDPKKILGISIPDWSVTPFAGGRDQALIRSEIDAYNQFLQESCRERSFTFLNITDISRYAKIDSKLWLCSDQLHPSCHMHRAWAERIAHAVRAMLAPIT